ncbi:MAG TPA: protein kinase, partial [Pseudomonadales bacterium]
MADQLQHVKTSLADRYRIERQLGRGGMATVYLAEDLKHHRQVAVKVLRPELVAVIGPERFLREIKLTARLNHPHILPLLDSGEAENILYYVMPYVEGESLRQKLNRETQLSINEALQLGQQVASALDYAHREGVIHRDVKPENILLHAGEATVADFGIALALSAAGGDRLTETGLSMGTPEYMSPEQASGAKNLDARSDIYSMGAVLYEMLAGEPPHTGPTAQAVIGKVVTERARPLRQLRDTVPPHVEAAVAKALERLAADRFATASEFTDAMMGRTPIALLATGPEGVVPDHGNGRRWRPLLPWAVAAAALSVAVWALLQRSEAPQALVIRSEITLPDTAPLALFGSAPLATQRPALAVSPDGSHIAFVGEWDGETHLYVRPLGEHECTRVEGTRGAYHPFFSPDGQWIGFFVGNRLRKVPVLGGPAVTLATTPNPHGAAWLSDERILVSPNEGRRLELVAAAGGIVETIGVAGTRQYNWPQALTRKDAVLVSGGVPDDMAVVVLATGETRSLGLQGWNPRYVASGYLVYVSPRGLWTVKFDTEELAV